MSTSSINSATTGLMVSSGETLEVLAGGSAVSASVSAGGVLQVSSGGAATATTVQSGGADYVFASGSASATTVDSGGAEYVSGGVAFSAVLSGGSQSVVSGGVASGTVVDSAGHQYVSAGGSAVSAVLSLGGFQSVGSGGLASNTVVDAQAFAYVLSGGTASGTTVNSGGHAYVSGGSAVGTLLNSSGYEFVVFGGKAVSTTVEAHATAFVSAGGVASFTSVTSGGAEYVGLSGSDSAATVGSGGYLEVDSGGVTTSSIVLSSGQEVVSTGGVASRTTIGSGGVELVLSGGSAVSATVSSGGVLVVLKGGNATSTVSSGGAVSSAAVVLRTPGAVSAWATVATTGLTVGSGGTLYVFTGGVAAGAVLSGGADIVQGGSASFTAVVGGSESVGAGGLVSSSTVGAGGIERVSSGGVAAGTQVSKGGLLLVSSGGFASGTAISSGGSAVVLTSGSAGVMTIDSSGLLVLTSGAQTFGSIVFSGGGAALDIGGTVTPSVTLSGFAIGETIDLTAISGASASLASASATSAVLVVSSGGTTLDLQLAGNYVGETAHYAPDATGSGTDLTLACFAEGTRIATVRGPVAVERLRQGDRALLARGGSAPIVWLGHRRVVFARHRRPWDVLPVRVREGAFAPGVPARDLLLSPGHAVHLDGVLIPVCHLLNGATIAQEQAEAITYWHVELAAHDVLLAEGLPTESYLDTGNRSDFSNGGTAVRAHPDFARPALARDIWEREGCAPMVTEGPALARAKEPLWHRATGLGHRWTSAPALRVEADGAILPMATDGSYHRVSLPPDARILRLCSRAWVPAHMCADSTDTRVLGIAVGRVWLDGRLVALDDPALGEGWHAPEDGWRWTDGGGRIDVREARSLAFDLASTGTYWLAPSGEQRPRARAAAP